MGETAKNLEQVPDLPESRLIFREPGVQVQAVLDNIVQLDTGYTPVQPPVYDHPLPFNFQMPEPSVSTRAAIEKIDLEPRFINPEASSLYKMGNILVAARMREQQQKNVFAHRLIKSLRDLYRIRTRSLPKSQ